MPRAATRAAARDDGRLEPLDETFLDGVGSCEANAGEGSNEDELEAHLQLVVLVADLGGGDESEPGAEAWAFIPLERIGLSL